MGSVSGLEYNSSDLSAVFGVESRGTVPEDRAATSKQIFVRSQVQVTFDNERARGRKLIATEALEVFGWDVLLKVAREGSASLVQGIKEPAATIAACRNRLAISLAHLSRQTQISIDKLENIEKEGALSSIRDLEKVSQALSIDERYLGLIQGGKSDNQLAVRLRKLGEGQQDFQLSPTSVMMLSEAAWVISRQADLQLSLSRFSNHKNIPSFHKDHNYSHPAWKQGFRLAALTRQALGISSTEPISRLRNLIETRLEIPLVQQKLSAKFAGATLSNGPHRGIVVNEEGANSNVWTRRMTLCHELGHLLWDPEQRLNKLKVDTYSRIDSFEFKKIKDPVEERANAFAVAFLAPPLAVEQIMAQEPTLLHAVASLMHNYGISMSAAKRHIENITKRDTSKLESWRLPSPSDEWVGRENFTLDWFPSRGTPLSRRGKFAWIVALSYQRKKISADSASMYLDIAASDIPQKCDEILEIYKSE